MEKPNYISVSLLLIKFKSGKKRITSLFPFQKPKTWSRRDQ